jgi:hypothetical protein
MAMLTTEPHVLADQMNKEPLQKFRTIIPLGQQRTNLCNREKLR